MKKPDEVTVAGKRLLKRSWFGADNGYWTIPWGGDRMAGTIRAAKRLVAQGYYWTPGGSEYGLTDKGREWCKEHFGSTRPSQKEESK